ncbi:hypothetical protein [Romboutsia lituseburensis]|uniref:hypothetical protein n=1 Tax=Romboutsia lituseburensis TaxID=1537 RepID=UPI0022EB1A30|nr:hypothetical protein [Romboutsia lituseburensis]
MEIAQEMTSNVANTGIDIQLIVLSIINFFNIALNLAIKILAVYTMYLSIRALKKYLNT